MPPGLHKFPPFRNFMVNQKYLYLVIIFFIFLFIISFAFFRPTTRTYVSSEAMVQQTPMAILSPWLCWISETVLSCQATNDIIIRRGQRETFFGRGYTISFKNPVGTGKAQIWFGCTGTNSCDGQPIFSSQSIKAESNSSGSIIVSGKEDVIPFGSLGIIETEVENNKFISLRNRWAGAIAPPVLKPGPGISINCTADNCTIGKL